MDAGLLNSLNKDQIPIYSLNDLKIPFLDVLVLINYHASIYNRLFNVNANRSNCPQTNDGDWQVNRMSERRFIN